MEQGIHSILRRWDKGSKHVRQQILQQLVQQYKGKAVVELEDEFQGGASLLFARITLWLKSTCAVQFALSLQLEAISLFLRSTTGDRFLGEFVETDGIPTVIDILSRSPMSEANKSKTLDLLKIICEGGRMRKEMLCQNQAIQSTTGCMRVSVDSDTLQKAQHFLVQLGTGNPEFAQQIHCGLLGLFSDVNCSPECKCLAAQAVLVLLVEEGQLNCSYVDVNEDFVKSTIQLMKQNNLQMQFEACELLKILSGCNSLGKTVVNELAKLMYSDCSTAGTGDAGDSHSGLVLCSSQVCAVKCLGEISNVSASVSQQIASKTILPGILRCLCNHNTEIRTVARSALTSFSRQSPEFKEEMKNFMGEPLIEAVLSEQSGESFQISDKQMAKMEAQISKTMVEIEGLQFRE